MLEATVCSITLHKIHVNGPPKFTFQLFRFCAYAIHSQSIHLNSMADILRVGGTDSYFLL